MCNGKINTELICDCYTNNCCDAVRTGEISEECPHREWVECYGAFYRRVMREISVEVVENFEGGA